MFAKLPLTIRKLTIIYALIQFLYYFNFFWLIQNVYFLNNGLNFKQLSILLGVWSLSVIVFEIPSGILADRFGRKSIILLGKLGFLLGILSFIYLKNFPGFLLGMIFWGIHESFISGALEALVYDYIKVNNNENLFNRVLTIATVSREVGLGLGVLIAGVITQIGINYNLIGSVIIAFLGCAISFMLPNPKPFAQSQETKLLHFFNNAWSKVKTDTNLVNILVFTLFVLVSYQVISEYFVVSLKELNLNFSVIGILAFLEMMFFSFGASIANRMSTKFYEKSYAILSLLMGFGVLFLTTTALIIVIVAWMVLRVVKANSEIISNTDWQTRVDSRDRATTTSIRSFMGNIWYMPLAYLFGALADHSGLFNAFYLIAGTSLLYSLYWIWVKKI